MASVTKTETNKEEESRRGIRRMQTRTVERTSIMYDDGSSELNQKFSSWHKPPCGQCGEHTCNGDHP